MRDDKGRIVKTPTEQREADKQQLQLEQDTAAGKIIKARAEKETGLDNKNNIFRR